MPAPKNDAPVAGRGETGLMGSCMKTDLDAATVWPVITRLADVEGASDHRTEPAEGVWQNTIAAADQALEEATRIQRGVQHNLKVQQELRALREELRRAHAEIDRYRGMHARVVVSMRQLEEDHTTEMTRLQADNEMLLVRHRVYKLLAEHYGTAALRFEPAVFAEHRDRVLEHVLFQRRRGVPVTEISSAEVAFLLL
ncbi:hypothetical protein SAMN04488595_101443 [Ralstonia sp. 25mfcol4.1]|nr:hypothetical protein SAMN04488595_101443 [Ralstonia sp. 25mfcol4.1]